MSEDSIKMSGVMSKKGALRHNWTDRYFTLRDGTLCYYAAENDKTPKGYILTKDITEVREKTSDKIGSKSGKGEFVFEVVTPKRVYYFSPSDAAAKADWMKAIQSWVGKKKKVPEKEAPSTDGKISVRQERTASNVAMMKEKEEAEKKQKAEAGDDAEMSDEGNAGEKYVCSFDYEAAEDNELSFLEGDILMVLDKFISNGQPAGWWKCELNGVVGLAPSTFLTTLS